ncbi:MAG: nucleotidyltransferase family protein [Polyangiaceae bacterium]|nr:nucleotidyltransferase family protein [Polyangiaceae bacterium]
MNLVDELHAIVAALGAARIEYAVCGGVAVTVHGATRTTKDIDLLIRPDDVARALQALRPLGYDFAALPMVFEENTERERRVQRVTKLEGGHALVIDLLFAHASFAGFLDDRVAVELPRGTLFVVSRETLLRMKRLAGRAQDQADIEKLESVDEG